MDSVRNILIAILFAAAAVIWASPTGDSPVLWPEEERQFFQDGPGLLLSETARDEFLGLDSSGRRQAMARFLSRDPVEETEINELTVGIEKRRKP